MIEIIVSLFLISHVAGGILWYMLGVNHGRKLEQVDENERRQLRRVRVG